jgi:hypothetical protein
MYLPLLLFFLFWSVGPALLASWVFGEGGRSRLAGLMFGFFLGPAGVVAASLFVKYFAARRNTSGGRTGGRAVRLFYHAPLVGRLHVSTVWALAGFATFVCAWGAGGVAYEILRGDGRGDSQGLTPAGAVARGSQPEGAGPGVGPAADAREQTAGLSRADRLPPAAYVNGLAAKPQRTSAPEEAAKSVPADARVAGAHVAQGGAAERQPDDAARPAAAASPVAAPREGPSPTQNPAASSRQAAVAEATRLLASNGHRAYASVSGDERTTTLSLSGATLTRAAGNQLLGNARVRSALKSSGVRIVVVLNGTESWTYLL